MIVGMENTPALYLLIGSISVSAWAVAQCASVRKREALYKLAVGMVLISLAMWASVDFSGEGISLLQIAMRWLAVSLLLLPTKLWFLPSMLGSKLAESWKDALRWGKCFGQLHRHHVSVSDADPGDIHADRSGDFEHSLCSRLRSGLHVGCLDHLGSPDCSFHRAKILTT